MNASPGGRAEKSHGPLIVQIGCARAPSREARDDADRFIRFFRRLVRATAGMLAERRSDSPAGRSAVRVRILGHLPEASDPGSLLRRVRRSDLVILDTTGGSAELIGDVRAIMSARGKSASLFLLGQSGPPGTSARGVFPDRPGDFSFTRYEPCVRRGRPTLRLVEPLGFAAALGSSLMEAARERGRWQEVSGR